MPQGEEAAASSHYLPDAQRFVRDFAAEERERNAAVVSRKHAELERRRRADAEREAARWASMDAADAAEAARLAALRSDGGKARKNKGALPFDIVRMAYHGTADGDDLR